MPKIRFDRFYRYAELTGFLHDCAAEHPGLFALESIGKSYEGRDIWLATVTNTATGPASEKPAFWLEANIHASEVTGSAAAMHLLHKLVTGYGSDAKVTRALDTRTFYVVPRLNPDGAELALADRPRIVRSSTRPYPYTDLDDGLHREDIDGDGRLLSMRIEDRNGNWKEHPDEPRLLVRRDPDEDDLDATYYRLLPEGTIRNYDGTTIKIARPLEGLDLNRNFPIEWEPENRQRGAGPYPTSEPEIKAEVDAIVARRNICTYISYHTYTGVHLRPYSDHPDDYFPTGDLRTFNWIGDEMTKITGYPWVSIFHGFKYDPKQGLKGASDDWLYEHLGVYAWTTEFWSPMKAAGVKIDHHIEWFRNHPIEDELKLFAWNDKVLKGEGWVDWYPFDHPQLGRVELGGWDTMLCFTNVPPKLLEREIAPHTDLAVFFANISPRLELHAVERKRVGDGQHLIRLVVQNTGWLPTNVSQKAVERQAVRQLEAEITLPRGAKLLQGDEKQKGGQLTGRNFKRSALGLFGDPDVTTDRARFEWLVDAPEGGTVKIEARHDRAGVVRTEVSLRRVAAKARKQPKPGPERRPATKRKPRRRSA